MAVSGQTGSKLKVSALARNKAEDLADVFCACRSRQIIKSLTLVQGDGCCRSELCSKGRSAKRHLCFW